MSYWGKLLNRKKSSIISMVTMFVLLVTFQNCSDGFQSAFNEQSNQSLIADEEPQSRDQASENGNSNGVANSIKLIRKPRNTTGYVGESLEVEVVARATTDLSYQWEKDGQTLKMSSDGILTLPSLSLNDSGFYKVHISSENSTMVQEFQIQVAEAPDSNKDPVFTVYPENQMQAIGQELVLETDFDSYPKPKIQWYLNDQAIAGANKKFLHIASLGTASSGDYRIELTPPGGTPLAYSFKLIAGNDQQAPMIINSSKDTTSDAEATIELQLEALSLGKITYSWLKNGQTLAQEDQALLKLANLKPSDAATYTAIAANTAGRSQVTIEVKVNCPPASSVDSVNDRCVANEKNCSANNGQGKQIFSNNKYGACILESCDAKYSLDKANNRCVLTERPCKINQGDGIERFDGQSYGRCLAQACSSGYTLHQTENKCVVNERSCTVTNGNGTEKFNGKSYGTCQVTSCNQGFSLLAQSNRCSETKRSCPISGGFGEQVITGGKYGACKVVGCNGAHSKDSANNRCLPKQKTCSIRNGQGSQSLSGLKYGACQVTSCNQGYVKSGNSCVASSRSCTIANGTGTQSWNGSSWGGCVVQSCRGGYHKYGNSCRSNARACNVANGSGTQYWNGSAFGACQAQRCNSGFQLSGNACINRRVIYHNPTLRGSDGAVNWIAGARVAPTDDHTTWIIRAANINEQKYVATKYCQRMLGPRATLLHHSTTPLNVTHLASYCDTVRYAVYANGYHCSYAPWTLFSRFGNKPMHVFNRIDCQRN